MRASQPARANILVALDDVTTKFGAAGKAGLVPQPIRIEYVKESSS